MRYVLSKKKSVVQLKSSSYCLCLLENQVFLVSGNLKYARDMDKSLSAISDQRNKANFRQEDYLIDSCA